MMLLTLTGYISIQLEISHAAIQLYKLSDISTLLSSGKTELTEVPECDPAACVSSSAMPYDYGMDKKELREKSLEIRPVQTTNTLRHFRRNGRHYVSCTACCKFQDLVKRLSVKCQVPPIAMECGVIFRKETVRKHLQQPYHSQSLKAHRMTTLSPVDAVKMSDMGRSISKVNEKLAEKVGSLFVHAYGDAKKLTLSAFSFPARVVISTMASAFSWNCGKMTTEQDWNLQYLTPASHKEFLQCIVQSHQEILAKKLTNDVLALSIRCDGTVDRTQIDKIYVMAKVVRGVGSEEQYFLGASEPRCRGAKGILEALEEACINTVGESAAKHILRHASSLVTDGASINTGERSGLWTLFRAKMRDHQSTSVPLLTIWCAVHRSNLAWKSTSNSVSEIGHIFQNLVALSTYFHTSGLRSRELREVADLNNSHLVALPKLFEVRWSEFSYALVNSVLVSWFSLVLYMRQSKDKASSVFLAFLLDEDKLVLLSFLADVLTVFSRYQKLLQGDGITILDIEKTTKSVKARLLALTEDDLPGGWTKALKKELVLQPDGVTKILKGIELMRTKKRRKEHHQYVSDCRDVNAVCREVVASLVEFLDQRFDVDAQLMRTAKSFATLQPSANLEGVHSMLCPDLALSELSLEFWELLEMDNIEALRQMTLAQKVRFLASSDSYRSVTTVLARLLAAKPHSADVERLISTSSALKSTGRSSMSVNSENEYLYIYHNMPPLIEWDPRASVLLWLQKRVRRMRDTPKASKQRWFKGIFTLSASEQAECDYSFSQDITSDVAKPKAF